MKPIFEKRTLTQKEKRNLATWRNAADPTTRLFTDFYNLTHIALLNDYCKAMEAADDDEDKQDAYSDLTAALKKLREDCKRDWELLFEQLQATGKTFCPVKFQLQWMENTITE
jgi:hypothetical protein